MTAAPAPVNEPARPALTVRGLTAGYGGVTVLRGVDLVVRRGEVVALVGANGAGKTTLLRAISGTVPATGGTIHLGEDDVTRLSPAERARRGLCLIPEGRGIFRALTVEENLRLSTPPWIRPACPDAAYEAFPLLADRRRQVAGTMSGGQQQMLALSRAILSQASVVLLDEVSMGLAPLIVDVIFAALAALAAEGRSLLIVEQYVQRALAMADSVHLMRKGTVTHAGHPSTLDETRLVAEYLGQGMHSDQPVDERAGQAAVGE
ncbi:branched-chain amino acid transport system ATP-binding protein [Parafrankia irregularis]|uniref:Branched-chain amino acid transport system ATP-binding protein n=1 Tax=Parafrankia irregularis TaxID=795642 RepID=A0A0S4QLU8_9ACTN|nr:ABC transporter ATP-binding protein [Parafrankia irregularis]MBE3201344.1 ABC transporter ATP-binding protein [Parafrankia sp. CH37]CUU56201.1 branched-chain amino acid transport system ATP-binding protein [Parafrankia irregularis]